MFEGFSGDERGAIQDLQRALKQNEKGDYTEKAAMAAFERVAWEVMARWEAEIVQQKAEATERAREMAARAAEQQAYDELDKLEGGRLELDGGTP